MNNLAEKISITKGFDDDQFDTYVPELSDNADIQNAFELFYYGDSTSGNAVGDVSIHANLVDFDSRINSNDADISGHTGAVADVHGVGAGHNVVGTGTAQTLTNKTLTSPAISGATLSGTTTATSGTIALGTNASAITANGVTLSATEVGYLDSASANIQTQLNSKAPSASPTFTGTITLPTGSITSTFILDGTIVNGDINASAAIDWTKLAISASVSQAELSVLDGITSTTTQLNYLNSASANIQTQLNSKAFTTDLTTHEADTTSIHGIADTSKLARIASTPAGRTIFVQAATPTALATGDIWFQVTGL